MCQLTFTTPRTHLLSHLQCQSVPLAMEGLDHDSSQKTWQARLHKTGSILSYSAYQHNCQNPIGLRNQGPYRHGQTIPTTTCQPFQMLPRMDHNQFPTLCHETYKRHMEKR